MTPSLRIVTGDATAPKGSGNKIIAHVCNDVGGWGAGFVLAISKRWEKPEQDYRDWYAGRVSNGFGLGAVRLVQVEADIWVANMVAQRDVRRNRGVPPIRYEAVETALRTLAENARALSASVHMPRIGCGLAGGTWDEIGPIVDRTLVASGVDVVVYDFPAR